MSVNNIYRYYRLFNSELIRLITSSHDIVILFNFVTVTRKSLGSAVVDVKAIILRSTHPVTVKLTSGERYDTVHPQCNHCCTPLYIIVV